MYVWNPQAPQQRVFGFNLEGGEYQVLFVVEEEGLTIVDARQNPMLSAQARPGDTTVFRAFVQGLLSRRTSLQSRGLQRDIQTGEVDFALTMQELDVEMMEDIAQEEYLGVEGDWINAKGGIVKFR